MNEVEQEASKLGWQPAEAFKGDPDRWVDAETYLERGKQVLPILRKTNERLHAEVASLRSDMNRTQALLAEAEEAMKEFREYHAADSKRQYERALADLKADKKAALTDQDFDAVVEIDEAIRKLGEEPKPKTFEPKPAPAPDPSQDPVFLQWVEDNSSWYGKNKEQTAYANSVGTFLRVTNPDLKGRAFLDRVAEEVSSKFLDRSATAPDRVEGSRGGASGRTSGGKSYADLPPDAKQACDRFGKKLIGANRVYKTEAEWRKAYVADYFGVES